MTHREEAVFALVYQALEAVNEERSDGHKVPLAPESCLFGSGALLDSLELVSVIVDVEAALSEAFGAAVSLTDDRAMSQEPPPFSQVSTLVAYALELLDEQPG